MLGIGPELVDPTIDPLSSVIEQSLTHGLLPYPTVLALIRIHGCLREVHAEWREFFGHLASEGDSTWGLGRVCCLSKLVISDIDNDHVFFIKADNHP